MLAFTDKYTEEQWNKIVNTAINAQERAIRASGKSGESAVLALIDAQSHACVVDVMKTFNQPGRVYLLSANPVDEHDGVLKEFSFAIYQHMSNDGITKGCNIYENTVSIFSRLEKPMIVGGLVNHGDDRRPAWSLHS